MMSDEESESASGGHSNPKDGIDNSAKKPSPTAEEQLAEWEESLKNDDWGHQPC